MNVKINLIQKTGMNKERCEDVVHTFTERPGYFFAGMADGQSKKKFCVEGGGIALTEADLFFRNRQFSPLYQKNTYPDESQYRLIHRIRTQIAQEAIERGNGTACSDFSSTLCGIAGNLKKGIYSLVHLGDGCILGLTKEYNLQVISSPENGFTRSHTYLTTSPSALTHLRFGSGELSRYIAFYLLSDGANNICKDGYIVPKAKELLIEQEFESLREYMEQSNYRDDASLVMLSLH